MGLTMKKILNKFDDCDMLSLTGRIFRGNITISQEEFTKALNKIEQKNKEEKRIIYEDSKEKFKNYPEFDKLYEEIKKECYEFDCEKNREFYLNKNFSNEQIEQYKKIGITDEKINEIKKNFFHCSFIADQVGKTTKYGNENKGFFWHLYHDISMNIDRQKDKETYCNNSGKSPLEQIPSELKENFLYYEVSFYNSVTISSGLMINYYFKLNDETKKYLLKFRNDFCIDELEDLTLYKDGEIRFYSCTHERFNSLKLDYKNMPYEDLLDFINDEFFEENNDVVIEMVNKLINMKIGTKFSFKGLGISSKILMNKICTICSKLNLQLVSSENKEHDWSTINENGDLKKARELPAILCNVEDLIQKKC